MADEAAGLVDGDGHDGDCLVSMLGRQGRVAAELDLLGHLGKVGKAPGSTTLLLIRNDGTQKTLNVAVFARPPGLVEKELSDLLSGLSVQARRVGPQIVLDGVVTSEADLRRVQQITSLYPEQVTSLVQLSEPGTLSGAGLARSLIRIDFYFVQYDENGSYQVGVGWPESVGSGATGTYAYDFLAGGTRTATA